MARVKTITKNVAGVNEIFELHVNSKSGKWSIKCPSKIADVVSKIPASFDTMQAAENEIYRICKDYESAAQKIEDRIFFKLVDQPGHFEKSDVCKQAFLMFDFVPVRVVKTGAKTEYFIIIKAKKTDWIVESGLCSIVEVCESDHFVSQRHSHYFGSGRGVDPAKSQSIPFSSTAFYTFEKIQDGVSDITKKLFLFLDAVNQSGSIEGAKQFLNLLPAGDEKE